MKLTYIIKNAIFITQPDFVSMSTPWYTQWSKESVMDQTMKIIKAPTKFDLTLALLASTSEKPVFLPMMVEETGDGKPWPCRVKTVERADDSGENWIVTGTTIAGRNEHAPYEARFRTDRDWGTFVVTVF